MDRILRVVLGIVLLTIPFVSGLAIFNSGIATVVAVLAGIVLLATSAMRFCPMYRIFGIRTCKP
jgi:hypothetical protein